MSLKGFKQKTTHFFKHAAEEPVTVVLFLCASFSIVILSLMLFFVAREGLLAFSSYGPNFLVGQTWDTKKSIFGAFPFIYGSLMVVAGALAMAIPLGICTAIFISEVLPFSLRDPIKSIIELLASIPSVIYGFIGLILVVPAIVYIFGVNSGRTALAASLLLTVMSVPTIVAISGETISAVPKEYKEAAFGLGATRWQTIKNVILPISKSGILASVMLGFGRAIGETVAVVMVAGNNATVPVPFWNFLAPVYTMTSVIAVQFPEAAVGSPEYSALFGVALLLFIITFIVNTLADSVVKGKLSIRRLRL